jgi:hypothetical protein
MHARAGPGVPAPYGPWWQSLVAGAFGWRAWGAFLPLPDRIADNETYLHTARTLAADMAGAIRNPKKP